ncbi:uncharacterized protein YndB with AHSA1/START domain [Mycolicibacterium iranicum]|uniref:Uncharacterized protein YndB with AHSA1/START domain n=1 Tax=Mycolicibacterium iranicum TaxID=912594 RepID=A0A839QBB5_MYCIR|nr:SRPBCC family protein [Mycolicibacterium iranicum]MBB2993429.1 uncharacterized protein YndB with AHSA1/START domain [Mycolicibacterium iranicum]
MSVDRIEKQALLDAPLERVWDALIDSSKFGTWFGMRLDGPFVEGATVSGEITETQVDDEIAARQRPYTGAPVTLWIVAVEPLQRLAFRWNPLPDSDFAELTTLVELTLSRQPDGTLLEIVESGFEALPDDHRDRTRDGNSEGWSLQLQLIAKFVALHAAR